MQKIDPNGEAAAVVGTRFLGPDLVWIDAKVVELGYKTRSELMRRLVRLAQEHEKELEAAS